jgi:outer membrane protein assembly factor BamB
MNSVVLTRCSLLLLFSCTATAAIADDWYRWRGPDQNGISRETSWDHQRITDPDAILWRRHVGIGFSSLVTKIGMVYTIGNNDDADTVFCLNASTGDIVWQHSYPSPLDDRDFEGGPTSTPTIDGDRLYVLSRSGDLFCLRVDSGELLWQQQIVDLADVRIPGWGFSAAPVVVDEILLINAGDAGVAMNKMTGELIWKSADKDCGYGTPTLMKQQAGTTAIIPSGRSYVAVDVSTGAEQWRQRWLTSFGCNAADPIIDGSRVFLCSGYNRGAALLEINQGGVEVLWKNKDMQNQISSSILIGGFLYGVDGDLEKGSQLTCLELDSGKVMWSEADLQPGAIAATPDRLIILSTTGELVVAAASSESFQVLARAAVLEGKCWTTPVLSDQKIYCRSADGELACVDVSAKTK